jgi:hypothetical protein
MTSTPSVTLVAGILAPATAALLIMSVAIPSLVAGALTATVGLTGTVLGIIGVADAYKRGTALAGAALAVNAALTLIVLAFGALAFITTH